MTVTALRQPAPNMCSTPEQAIAILRLGLDTPEAAYATSYVDGWFAGHTLRLSGGFTTEQANRHMSVYLSRCSALPLADALVAAQQVAWRDDALSDMGWLRGYFDATDGMDGAHECDVTDCKRRLVEDVDGAHHCRVDGSWFCASEVRDCWAPACPTSSAVHARECHDSDGI